MIVARVPGEQGVELPLQPRGVVVLARATFPELAAKLIGEASATSGSGKGDPTDASEYYNEK
jgi:hypothetical protein